MLKIVPGEPAALIKGKEKVLVAADLHIGFEKELSRIGVNIPSQTEKLFLKLKSLINRLKPDRVILLGDVKHGVPAISDQEWADLPLFFEKLLESGVSVEVVPGNHDGNLEPLTPRGVVIHDSRGVEVEGVALLHGHTWPSPRLLACKTMLMGHNHLVVELRDGLGFREVVPVWLMVEVPPPSAKELCMKVTRNREEWSRLKISRLVVMPAFNTLLSGKPVNSEERSFLGPILESGLLELQDSEVYMIDGTYMGRVGEIPRLPY